MLRLCLASLLRQTVAVNEVIVVHCGSDSDTEAVTQDPAWRRSGLDCRYVRHSECNAARQRNFAVARAAHDNLLLLDDDVELEREWVEELFKPIWNDLSVGATMGRLINQPMDRPTLIWRLYRRLLAGEQNAFTPGHLVGAVVPNGFPLTASRHIATEWIGGGVTAARRAAFESIGGFAPYFSGSSPGEDMDFGYRLSRHWKVLYVPTARGVHHRDTAGRADPATYEFQSIRSRYAILVRAFEKSPAMALAHIFWWALFQSVSEIAALRRGRVGSLPAVWWGRLRGITSCLGWSPAFSPTVPEMFPVSGRE